MPRFNTATRTVADTVNYAGGQAYTESAELELVSLVLTSFVQDQFYRKADESIERVSELVAALPDKKFAAQAAVYARTKFGMRSISHVVAGEIAKQVKGEEWTKDFFKAVVYRADDITEILSYYISRYGRRPLPHSMRKGLGQALIRFDEYQLSKYRGEGRSIKLVDAANLTRPKGGDAALSKLMKDDLRATETWEAKLSDAGQANDDTELTKEERKAGAWKEWLANRPSYFALLRNLRNIAQQAPKDLPRALELLVNTEAIKKSLVLPFRFITAMEETEKAGLSQQRAISIALFKAVEISLSNIPNLSGRTLVAVDVSGSMSGRPSMIASLFGAGLFKTNDCDVMVFGSSARYILARPTDSLATIADQLKARNESTDFHAIFSTADKVYDRIVVLSDMQGWVGGSTPKRELQAYRSKFNCDPHVYSFDLAGQGTLQFPENKVYALAGFSERVFDVMGLLEHDRTALLSTIKAVKF